ncbi:MAG: kelch repeat-containing protein [Pirellulaceae bacterium]
MNSSTTWPDLPRAITSFGAAALGDAVFVYGGHHGKAHHYYDEGQSGELLRLNVRDAAGWDVVSVGPRLQGLAMVAHQERLYRLGGFEARNTVDQEQNLWSIDHFACFDPAAGVWRDLPPMPEPRSSFDAAVLEGVLYVVGGWKLCGDREASWCETACACDLNSAAPVWREIPPPPFQRRALSVAALDGRIYVLGGMQPDGAVSRATAVFDPASRQWSGGPDLPGEEMEAFGTACCSLEGRLYVSTSSGRVLRLAPSGDAWEEVATLGDGRFFHRMTPIRDARLLLIGGASMQRGKYKSVESVRIEG